MYFAVAAVVLAALSQVAQATPALSRVATRIEPSREAVNIAGKFPVRELSSVTAQPLANGTLPSSVFRSDVAGGAGSILLLCQSPSCLAGCFAFDLSQALPENECLIDESSTFSSAAISQPSNAGLPFEVLVGPSGCLSFAPLTAVNECFNVNPAPFADFAILT